MCRSAGTLSCGFAAFRLPNALLCDGHCRRRSNPPAVRFANPLKLESRQLRIVRELFGVASGQAMSALGTLIGLRLLTAALGPHEYGVLALALTAPLLLGLVVYAGPGQAVMRFYAAADASGESASFLAAAWRSVIWRTLALLGLALVIAVAAALITGSLSWWSIALAALINGILTAFATVLDGFQNALRHRFTVAWHGALGVWLRFLLALALFRVLGATGGIALWGYTLASAIVLISQYAFYHRSRRHAASDTRSPALVAGWRSRVDRFSWPFSVFGIVAWLQSSSERWSLQAFSTTTVVGEYAALSQLGLGLTALLANVMLQLGLPIFYQRAGDGSDPHAVRAAHRLNLIFLGATALATAGLVMGSLLFHRQIFQITVARSFLPVSHLLPWMMLSGGILACAQVSTGFLLTNTESHRLILPKALSSLAGALAMIAGARLAGVTGVVWGSVGASTLHLALVLGSARLGARPRDPSIAKSPETLVDIAGPA